MEHEINIQGWTPDLLSFVKDFRIRDLTDCRTNPPTPLLNEPIWSRSTLDNPLQMWTESIPLDHKFEASKVKIEFREGEMTISAERLHKRRSRWNGASTLIENSCTVHIPRYVDPLLIKAWMTPEGEVKVFAPVAEPMHWQLNFNLENFKKDKLDMRLKGNTLKISSEAQGESHGAEQWHRKMTRVVVLPKEVDSSKLQVIQTDRGILKIMAPLKKESEEGASPENEIQIQLMHAPTQKQYAAMLDRNPNLNLHPSTLVRENPPATQQHHPLLPPPPPPPEHFPLDHTQQYRPVMPRPPMLPRSNVTQIPPPTMAVPHSLQHYRPTTAPQSPAGQQQITQPMLMQCMALLGEMMNNFQMHQQPTTTPQQPDIMQPPPPIMPAQPLILETPPVMNQETPPVMNQETPPVMNQETIPPQTPVVQPPPAVKQKQTAQKQDIPTQNQQATAQQQQPDDFDEFDEFEQPYLTKKQQKPTKKERRREKRKQQREKNKQTNQQAVVDDEQASLPPLTEETQQPTGDEQQQQQEQPQQPNQNASTEHHSPNEDQAEKAK